MEQNSVSTQNGNVEISSNAKQTWVMKTLVIGGLIGAVAGLIGAYIFINNHGDDDDEGLDAATGVQLGLGILGVLRLLTL